MGTSSARAEASARMTRAARFVILGALVCLSSGISLPPKHKETSFWMKSGQENLRHILSLQNNQNRAKNVIIFIGDGMGLSTITSGRIYKGQLKGNTGEEYKLVFEKFPSTGFSKTYNVDRQVPDSAGTATAMFTGVKAQYRMLGLDELAKYNTCDKQGNENSHLTTIATWAQESGMDTGFVTTTRVTHATPGALYAHVNNRDWECDTTVPVEHRACIKDIARQLIEDEPGNKFKVIMGGGAGVLGLTMADPEPEACKREDGRQLVHDWLNADPGARLVTTTKDLMALDLANATKLMGIFGSDHLPYAAVKPDHVPSLANMTLQAIRMLRKNKNGFFLMVEGGKIDLAHHQNLARMALREVSELDDAVSTAMQNVNLDETLIIVTADHSHAFTMNGYPERGNDILGLTHNFGSLQNYETLSYANGPSFYYHRNNGSGVNDTWRNLEVENSRTDPFYRHFAARYIKDETHGGEDVGVYAIGPYSHLFRSTFEQNYIAHVIAYAACFKDWPSHCDQDYNRYFYEVSSQSRSASDLAVVSVALLVLGLLAHLSR
ncbi:PREDICTED: alkaline phosphatase 4-like [Ceratosolen solmsi marchali]|uniref:Alkaline phosphatase n=1 Tax=Ceratosolen solmsi marchali TaxID=326594 RepID=A0AAJ6YEV9_9HYME|nr:PREDICTED: alkaline phosphatase 4-like [Ceratosolen solmsi marchali]